MYQQAEDGKTELSLMHFAITNPGWQPPRESTAFLGFLKEQVQRDGGAAGLAQGGLLPENALFTSIQSLQSESEVCFWGLGNDGQSGLQALELRTRHGVEAPNPLVFLLSVQSVPLGADMQNTGGPRGLPHALRVLLSFIATEPYCKCGSWLILPGRPTAQRPAGLQAQG